jgi:V/A-type H+-transporting ATPase subunit D
MAEQLPSRAALLELRRERAVIDQGYRFLDEKRIALGQELMNMLREHARLAGEFRSATMEARTALAKALERHGLESLQLYPAAPADRWSLQRRESRFLGLAVLAEAQLVGEHGGGADAACHVSAAAERCAEAFARLCRLAAPLAAAETNLRRLIAEFRRTQRRVRALEHVVLPEVLCNERRIEGLLEELEQEEAVRVRTVSAHRKA